MITADLKDTDLTMDAALQPVEYWEHKQQSFHVALHTLSSACYN